MAGYEQSDSVKSHPNLYQNAHQIARRDSSGLSPTAGHRPGPAPVQQEYGSAADAFCPQESHPGYPQATAEPVSPVVMPSDNEYKAYAEPPVTRRLVPGQPVVSRSAPYYSDAQARLHSHAVAEAYSQGQNHDPDSGVAPTYGPDSGATQKRTPVHYVGALVSVALIAGLGVWGYEIAMRDVNGIPVVRALDGPMRLLPDDPGGRQALYQGLSVNGVQAGGDAGSVADRLILAPPPIDLFAADAPVQVATIAGIVRNSPGQDAVSAAVSNAVLASLTSEVEVEENIVAPKVQLLIAPIAVAEDDVSLPEPVAPETAAFVKAVSYIPATVPGVSRSKIPLPRPELDLSRYNREVDAAVAAATGIAVIDADPANVVAGASLVQLGAYESQDVARAEWIRIAGRFESHFDGKQRVIQAASSGGRNFYRLRVLGFEDMSGARRFCSELIANNAACIPVVIR